jgi:hypothetical protein
MLKSAAVLVNVLFCLETLAKSKMNMLPEVIGENFLYFGFGSNLLANRIHINNPTAIRKGIGKLKVNRLRS